MKSRKHLHKRCLLPTGTGASLINSWWRIRLQCRRPWYDYWVRKIRWKRDRLSTPVLSGFPYGSAGKESAYNVGDLGSIPVLGRSPEEGNRCWLRYSGLENSMDCMGPQRVGTRLRNFPFTSLTGTTAYEYSCPLPIRQNPVNETCEVIRVNHEFIKHLRKRWGGWEIVNKLRASLPYHRCWKKCI